MKWFGERGRKGASRDQRSSDARLRAASWVSILALLATGGLWPYLSPYEVFVRFIVAGDAFVCVFLAFARRRYVYAFVFGALVLFYNPVAPVLGLTSGWLCVLVATSALPFVASLAWRNGRNRHHD